MSYEDLLLLARNLLRDHPEVRREEAERIRFILIDEFQDTDPLQYEIVFLLGARDRETRIADPFAVALEPSRLFIVGDPKQSIYRFRGADMAAFVRARDRVVEVGAEANLVTNFRSVPEVVAPLNRLFADWIGPHDRGRARRGAALRADPRLPRPGDRRAARGTLVGGRSGGNARGGAPPRRGARDRAGDPSASAIPPRGSISATAPARCATSRS